MRTSNLALEVKPKIMMIHCYQKDISKILFNLELLLTLEAYLVNIEFSNFQYHSIKNTIYAVFDRA